LFGIEHNSGAGLNCLIFSVYGRGADTQAYRARWSQRARAMVFTAPGSFAQHLVDDFRGLPLERFFGHIVHEWRAVHDAVGRDLTAEEMAGLEAHVESEVAGIARQGVALHVYLLDMEPTRVRVITADDLRPPSMVGMYRGDELHPIRASILHTPSGVGHYERIYRLPLSELARMWDWERRQARALKAEVQRVTRERDEAIAGARAQAHAHNSSLDRALSEWYEHQVRRLGLVCPCRPS
jgi:hypothetical protein